MSIAEKLITIAENEQKVYNAGQLDTLKNSRYMHPTVTGGIVSVNDVTPIEHNVGVKLTSKNLYAPTLQNFNGNGITAVKNNDNTYTINGTASEEIYIHIGEVLPCEEGKTYYFSGGTANIFVAYQLINNGSAVKSITVNDRVQSDNATNWNEVNVVIEIPKGTVADNVVIKPMISLFDNTPYTPYVADLTGVEVARYGKNLYDIQYLADNGVARIDDVETGEYTIISTPSKAPVYIPALPKTSYRVSGYVRGVQEGQNILVSCYYTDGSNDNVRVVTVLGEFVRFDGITRADKTLSHIVTGASGGIKNNTTFKEFQVELAETATDYEPCNKTIYTANADGTVEGVKSISPNMTLIPNNNAVTVECEYLRDIDLYIDNLITNVALTGGN